MLKKRFFNEQFYKTIVFQWENEEIDGKWKITLRKSEIKFLLKDKKTYKMNYEWTIWKKSRAPISRKTLAPMAAMSWPNNTFRQIKGLYTIRLQQKKFEFEAFVNFWSSFENQALTLNWLKNLMCVC